MLNTSRNLAAVLAGITFSSTAWACSCGAFEPAGFVHADVTRLPSNARGALFIPPTDGLRVIGYYRDEAIIYAGAIQALSPASFVITSDTDQRSLRPQLTRLPLARDAEAPATERAFRFVRKADEARFEKRAPKAHWKDLLAAGTLIDISADVKAASDLLRVGPEGGFMPGSRYQIAYVGKESGRWKHPAKTGFTIDKQAFQASEFDYALVADGAPLRRMLRLSSGRGSCTSQQSAIVQEFHYGMPSAAQPYQGAFLYFSEFRPVQPATRMPARFTPLLYQGDMCSDPAYGASARGEGRELMEVPCDSARGRTAIRGWTGLLEVEDQLHRATPIEVDFSKAATSSCTGFGMLKAALSEGDNKRIKDAVCALEGEEPHELRSAADGPALAAPAAPAADELPAVEELQALALGPDPDTRVCADAAMALLAAIKAKAK
jgi:hypothetical protein